MFNIKFKHIVYLNFNDSKLALDLSSKIDESDEKSSRLDNIKELPAKDLAQVDCLLVKLGAKVDKGLIDQLPNLKYIGLLGTGYGGIDTVYAASQGIMVTNIPNYATESVAEFTFGILLEQLRDIAKAKRQAETGDYSDNFIGREISGKKFGVIGLGNIGTRTAQLAQAFGAEVSYWSRNRKETLEERGIKYCELDTLLAESDIITLNLALNADTEGIINETRLKLIKKQALFINPSPMELLDFGALVRRLKKSDMKFILDHSDEMSVEQLETLQPLNNCTVYPAIAYLTREAGELKQRIYLENIKNFLAGQTTNSVS